MRVLSERALENIVLPELALDAAEEAFRIQSLGSAEVPLRSEIHRKDRRGVALVMSGLVDRLLAVKLIASAQDEATNSKATTCIMLLWDADNLNPRGLVSADKLNVHRTAAGFAAATRALAREDSAVHAVYGAGKLSLLSILYIARVRPIRRLMVVSRTAHRVDALMEELKKRPELDHVEFVTDASADAAAAQADIITTVTTSEVPVFDGRAIRPGVHLNLGGANRPHQRETDDAVARRARFWLDSNEGCRTCAGDLILPLRSGALSEPQIVGEIGETLLGLRPGRLSKDDITVFKSLGLAIQDIVLAGRVLNLADTQNLGAVIDVVNG